MLDSQSSAPGFESRSDHYLDLLLRSPEFKSSATLLNSQFAFLRPVGIIFYKLCLLHLLSNMAFSRNAHVYMVITIIQHLSRNLFHQTGWHHQRLFPVLWSFCNTEESNLTFTLPSFASLLIPTSNKARQSGERSMNPILIYSWTSIALGSTAMIDLKHQRIG